MKYSRIDRVKEWAIVSIYMGIALFVIAVDKLLVKLFKDISSDLENILTKSLNCKVYVRRGLLLRYEVIVPKKKFFQAINILILHGYIITPLTLYLSPLLLGKKIIIKKSIFHKEPEKMEYIFKS